MSTFLLNVLAFVATWGPKIASFGAAAPGILQKAASFLTWAEPYAVKLFPSWGHALDAAVAAITFLAAHVGQIASEGEKFFDDVPKLVELLSSEIPGLKPAEPPVPKVA